MTPNALHDIICTVRAAGFSIRSDGEQLLVRPVDRLPVELRATLAAHRDELVEFLHRARWTTRLLLVEAANRATDVRHDDDHDRAELIQMIDPPPSWPLQVHPDQKNVHSGLETASPGRFKHRLP